jgi:hypothetical protein
MTVERVNNVPSPTQRTKPQREDYKAIRESLMDPENAHQICIVAHGEMSGDAHSMVVALRGTKPVGDFHASVRLFKEGQERPPGLDLGHAVYAGYQLDDKNLEKLMGKAWMDKHVARRALKK